MALTPHKVSARCFPFSALSAPPNDSIGNFGAILNCCAYGVSLRLVCGLQSLYEVLSTCSQWITGVMAEREPDGTPVPNRARSTVVVQLHECVQ